LDVRKWSEARRNPLKSKASVSGEGKSSKKGGLKNDRAYEFIGEGEKKDDQIEGFFPDLTATGE